MKFRYAIIALLIGLVVIAVLLTAAWVQRPQLVEIQPTNQSTNTPVTASVQIAFSRPMNHESVANRLKFKPSVEGNYTWDENRLIFTPVNAWPGGQEIQVTLENGAKAASRLAFPMQGKSWSFTTSTANLAYLWPSDGPADLFELNPVSGAILQYTQGMGVLEFSASADGMLLYFSASNAQSGSDLYMLDRRQVIDPSNTTYKPQMILNCGSAQCRSPVVSPDGKYLVYEYLLPDVNGILGPSIVRLAWLQDMHMIPLGLAEHETVQPSWSATGWLAVYDRTSTSYEVFEPEANLEGELVNQTGQPGAWSPDGAFYLAPEIYYYQSTEMSETGTSHLLRYDVPAGTWIDLSKGDDVEDVEGTYSPAGEWIAFARKYLHEANWSFGRDIWLMKSDGSEPHAITNEPYYNHYDLAWSPDGQRLAYERFNEAKPYEPPELWMINADGSDPLQLVIGGYSPLWLP